MWLRFSTKKLDHYNGEFAEGFIHVHHLSPIAALKGEAEMKALLRNNA